MAEETKNALTAEDVRSLKTVFIGTNVIFWILAIFLIWIMYSFNSKLGELNTNTRQLMNVGSRLSLDGLLVVEGEYIQGATDEEMTVAYTLVSRNDMYMDSMYDESGMVEGDGMTDEVTPLEAPEEPPEAD